MLPEENMDLNPLPPPLPRPLPLPPGEGEFYILSFASIARSYFNRDVQRNDRLIINTPSYGLSQLGSAAAATESCND